MREYDYDDDAAEIPDDLRWGPIIVRRPVYDEAMKMLDKSAPEDGPLFETVRGIAQDCKASHEDDKADYWNEMAEFLEWRESVAEGTEVVVLEEGEEWDHDRGKKIKSRTKIKSKKKTKSRKKVNSRKKAKNTKRAKSSKKRAGKNPPRSGKS